MKRILFTFFLLLSCLENWAEHSYLLSNALDGSLDYHYTAKTPVGTTSGNP